VLFEFLSDMFSSGPAHALAFDLSPVFLLRESKGRES
jgi:hypothetical protein